jgi:DNA repair protein RecO (recombination protein O)
MPVRFTLQPAFILHTRAYRDQSLLIELFTFPQGRVVAIGRGSKTRFRGLMRPFIPLLATWSGKSELMNLSLVEANGLPYELQGHHLLCGIYLNELLVRLLHRHDPHPQLFLAYQKALSDLQHHLQPEQILREFEKKLLTELGYGLRLNFEISGIPVQADKWYEYLPEQGLREQTAVSGVSSHLFRGAELLSIHQDQLEKIEVRRSAKRLMRMAIEHLLGNKPPKTRELFLMS